MNLVLIWKSSQFNPVWQQTKSLKNMTSGAEISKLYNKTMIYIVAKWIPNDSMDDPIKGIVFVCEWHINVTPQT